MDNLDRIISMAWGEFQTNLYNQWVAFEAGPFNWMLDNPLAVTFIAGLVVVGLLVSWIFRSMEQSEKKVLKRALKNAKAEIKYFYDEEEAEVRRLTSVFEQVLGTREQRRRELESDLDNILGRRANPSEGDQFEQLRSMFDDMGIRIKAVHEDAPHTLEEVMRELESIKEVIPIAKSLPGQLNEIRALSGASVNPTEAFTHLGLGNPAGPYSPNNRKRGRLKQGDKCAGLGENEFKANNPVGINWVPKMAGYIGQTCKVIEVIDSNKIKVKFLNGKIWTYPTAAFQK